MRRNNSKLKVEFLEARMLLSAIDIPGDPSVAGAIESSGAGIEVDLDFAGQRLTISGPHDGTLTLNLDALPTNVTVLQVTSFDSVVLTGEHSFKSIVLSDVRDADLRKASVYDTIAAFDVDHIRIGEVQSNVLLAGPLADAAFTIGGRTLLEADSFATGVTIYSNVEYLGLSSKHPVESLQIENWITHPTVLMNFQPASFSTPGFDDPDSEISVVTGDFTTYFLASPSEQAALEQSQLVTRHPAVTTSAPLSNLLEDITLSSILSPGYEFKTIPLEIHPRAFSVENSSQTTTPQAGADNQATLENDGVAAMKLPFNFNDTLATPAESPFHYFSGNANEGHLKITAFGAFESDTHSSEHAGDAVSSAMHALSSRLAQPFSRFAYDFGATLATFGDLVAARLADHLRIDHQYALLVETRPLRTTDRKDLIILTV